MRKLKIKGNLNSDTEKKMNEISGKIEAGVEIVCEEIEQQEKELSEKSEMRSLKKEIALLISGILVYAAAIAIERFTHLNIF